MLWVLFNAQGQELGRASIGSLPNAGTNTFEIFAVFQGLNVANDGDYTGGSLKLYKPDLTNSTDLPLNMPVTTKQFDGESEYFTNGTSYQGVYFNFANYDNAIILDTAGSWRAVITLLHVRNQFIRNVVGALEFVVGAGNEDPNGTDVSLDDILENIYSQLDAKLDTDSNHYLKVIYTDEDISSYEFGEAYNIGDFVLNRYDNKLYKLDANKNPELTDLKLDSATLEDIYFVDNESYRIHGEHHLFLLRNDSGTIQIYCDDDGNRIDITSAVLRWNNNNIATENYVENRSVTISYDDDSGTFSPEEFAILSKTNAIIIRQRTSGGNVVTNYYYEKQSLSGQSGNNSFVFKNISSPNVTNLGSYSNRLEEFVIVNADRTWHTSSSSIQFYNKLQTDLKFAVGLTLDSDTYKLHLKNGNDTDLAVIDLPLESVVVDARYDDTTETIYLILDNGNEIPIPVHDLVAGLVNTEDLNDAIIKVIVMTSSPQTFTGDNFDYLKNNNNARILYNGVYYEKAYDDGTNVRFISVYKTSDTSGGYQTLQQPIIVWNKTTGVANSGQLHTMFYNKSQADAKFETLVDAAKHAPQYDMTDAVTTVNDIITNVGLNKIFVSYFKNETWVCRLFLDNTKYYLEIGNPVNLYVFGPFASTSTPIETSDGAEKWTNNAAIIVSSDSGTLDTRGKNVVQQSTAFIGLLNRGEWYYKASENESNYIFRYMNDGEDLTAGVISINHTIITVNKSTGAYSRSKSSLQTYSKAQVDSLYSSAIVYQGSQTVAQLNALDKTNLKTGSLYNVSDTGVLTYNGTELEVYAGDNVIWIAGTGWDKMTIDLSVYDDKFIAAGFFEVQNYDTTTGEITFVYASDLYNMTYDGNTGILTIEAN